MKQTACQGKSLQIPIRKPVRQKETAVLQSRISRIFFRRLYQTAALLRRNIPIQSRKAQEQGRKVPESFRWNRPFMLLEDFCQMPE